MKWGAQKHINLITGNTANEKMKLELLLSETIKTCILAYKIKCSVAFDLLKLKHGDHLLFQQI